MSRVVTLLLLLGPALLARAADDEFLGKPVSQWTRDLNSEAPSKRHLAAWSLAQSGVPAVDVLLAALSHDDPTVRFWAVQGLGRIAVQLGKDAARRQLILDELRKRLVDPAIAARIAAAEQVTRLGSAEEGRKVLVAALEDPQEAVRIQAISSLENLGELAQPARSAIEKGTSDPSEYVKRISTRLLEAIKR